MGKRKLSDIQGKYFGSPVDIQKKGEYICINGNWVSNIEYLRDPKYYNSLPFTEEYLSECGIDPKNIKNELLPDSLKAHE